MKKIFLLLFFIGAAITFTQAQPIVYNGNANTIIKVVSSSQNETVFDFSPGKITLAEVQTPSGVQYKVAMDKATPVLKSGAPDVPKLTASIVIPDQAAMQATIISSVYTDIPNVEIAPSKGTLSRIIDPSTVPFSYGPAYSQNQFYPQQLVTLRNPYILRDYRGQTVVVNPVQYNPVTKTLRVYTKISVKVFVAASGAVVNNPFFRNGVSQSTTPEFEEAYNHQFLNYKVYSKNNAAQSRYSPLPINGNMLIVCYNTYKQLMQPFIRWKEMEGISVEMVDVDSIGSNRGTIKDFVANYYNTKGLNYLLLVGDAHQVPPSATGVGPSDINYGYIVGNDHYPDIIVGRFSAETPEQLSTQVKRTLIYEKNPVPGNWFKHGIGVASNDGTGNDNLYDWEQERQLRNELLNFTYNDIAELYDGDHSAGGIDSPGYPTSGDLAAELDSGASVLNYTGHGGVTQLVTTGFYNSDVDKLTNTNRLPFMWIVGCETGDFVNGTACFAEETLRAEDSSKNPVGAIANFSSTINQYWDEPMEAQLGFNGILTGTDSDGVVSHIFGAICENGCMQMNDKYDSSGFDMTDTWVCFGDPSLLVRTDIPAPLTASHAPSVWLGINSFEVFCNTNGAKVCLYASGKILGVGFVSNNSVTINFDSALNITADSMWVTATYFNKIPYQAQVAILNNVSGIQSENDNSHFNVYPNPTDGNATIAYAVSPGDKVSVRAINLVGQIVKTFANNEIQASGQHQYLLNSGDLTQGVYIIELNAGGKKWYKKLVVE